MSSKTSSQEVFGAYAALLAVRRSRELSQRDKLHLASLRQWILDLASPTPLAPILIDLADSNLAVPLKDLLAQHGFTGVDASSRDTEASVAVTDPAAIRIHGLHASKAPLVLVNVSGPNALTGPLSTLMPTAFVPRPASAETVFEAIIRVLAQR
jgi:hypothetical protein